MLSSRPGSYHSISSTGNGVSFIFMEDTFPFLIRITLSAIGVRAELWVITITVMPLCLHISCNSFNMAFPV